MNPSRLIRRMRPFLDGHPRLRRIAQGLDRRVGVWRHSLAARLPQVIRPQPRQLTVAITARCNLVCEGCRYGRDFMVGEQLPIEVVRELLDDARDAGVNTVRFYGGEPLLHPDIVAAVEHSSRLGMNTYVTTNGTLLDERIDDLFAAGLRWLSMGFYGVGEEYAAYTGRDRYAALEAGIAAVRRRYGDRLGMQLNWVLLAPTCNLAALDEAWRFAERFDMYFHLDLMGYSIPFFSSGADDRLTFRERHRAEAEAVRDELIRRKESDPKRIPHSYEFLRSVPDWLMRGADMRVPCDAYELLWVGADGSVKLCDVCFPLGNLHRNRLRDLLYGPAHRAAARNAFQLNCPNCTCKVETRIQKHAPSLAAYRR